MPQALILFLFVISLFVPLLITLVRMLYRCFFYTPVHVDAGPAHDVGSTPAALEAELPRGKKMGMTEEEIMSLAAISFDKSALASAWPEIDVCTVCLGEFEDGEAVRVLPQCGHGFHRECVDVWLRKNASCPSRRRLVEAEHRIVIVVSRE